MTAAAPPAPESSSLSNATIGTYLLERLHGLGLRHLFGIPGDYVLDLFRLIEASPIRHIGTTREDCAGFAADAYARLNGIGAACVTYCVGGFNTVNAIACAYAERSPVVLLSGSPGLAERVQSPLLHHMVRGFNTQAEVFEKITVAWAILDDPLTARREIDRVLAALMRFKRPVYLEVPRDLVDAPLPPALAGPSRAAAAVEEETDPDALAEAVDEVRAMLSAARRPVVLAGAEIHRFGVQDDLVRLVERLNVPVAATLLGKSVLREDHPLYAGVYSGLVGREETQRLVSGADCLLLLGTTLTDIDVGTGASPIPSEGQAVHVTADRIAVKRHRYDRVLFPDFVRALADAPDLPSFAPPLRPPAPVLVFQPPILPPDDAPASLRGLFDMLDQKITRDMVVIADVGESLFAAADLHVRASTEFLSPAYYTSMGFAVPAAVGAAFAAPHLRPLVLVGDGAFQMTGTELSTCVRFGLNPVVLLLNNRGYGTEREILEGPFNDIHEWRYEKICDVLGGGVGHCVATQGEVARALDAALADPSQMHVINVLLDPSDRSPAMVRLARRLAERLSSPPPVATG